MVCRQMHVRHWCASVLRKEALHPCKRARRRLRKRNKERKENFPHAEIEVILGDVEERRKIFSSVSVAVTMIFGLLFSLAYYTTCGKLKKAIQLNNSVMF